EQSIVLLKNENNILPLDAASVHSIALIGSHADVGVLSGAGSAQVDAPGGKVEFNPGTDNASAAAFAKSADVAIVFVNQPMSEGMDRPTLSLPDNQDALVSAVAAANPHTIVVLETGSPVSMPWANQVQGIVEAWYPGIGGAQALANLLFG